MATNAQLRRGSRAIPEVGDVKATTVVPPMRTAQLRRANRKTVTPDAVKRSGEYYRRHPIPNEMAHQ